MNKKICIIGAGTYGSYLANALAEKFPAADIHVFEVGNVSAQSEEQIGFLSKEKSGKYKATSDGRFFGLGGTSAKWGGQLLFFSKKDFAAAGNMRSLVDCNIKYREKVLSRFFKNVPALEEKDFGSGLFSRRGVWLKFSQRNMFTHFRIDEKKNVNVHADVRITKFNALDGKIKSVEMLVKNQSRIFEADLFYLTSGAFESLRLMHVSGLMDLQSAAGFSDHVSMRSFEIHSTNTKIGNHDFQFQFENGSLITSRLIGESDNTSFYIHPVFNEGFIFFQFLKQLIFKGKFSGKTLLAAMSQFLHLFPFVWSYLFKKKLYVYKSWVLNVDMELSQSVNKVQLSAEEDGFRQKGLEIDYAISADSIDKLKKIRKDFAEILKKEGIPFTEVESGASSLKLEDTYHPYKLFGDKDVIENYHPATNLYLFNTGLLQRAGGINPTAALFCLIEHHVEELSISAK
ncbi:MAG: hypothetical protein ACKOXB_06150 [Flavobacteriales bacterium]